MNRIVHISYQLTIQFCILMSIEKIFSASMTRQPFGFKMCVEFCKILGDCYAPNFILSQMKCSCIIEELAGLSKFVDFTSNNGHPQSLSTRTKGIRIGNEIWNSARSRKLDDGHTCLKPQLIAEAKPTGIQAMDHNYTNEILHHACEEGKLCLVQYILGKGLSDIDCRGRWGRTPVMAAARMGKSQMFDFLVNQCCDLSAVDVKKDNVLHMACTGGNIDIVKNLVVSLKYDTEDKGMNGMTPVVTAAGNGHVGVVKFLVSKGCNLRAIDDNKCNILHVACMGGHVDMVKYIRLLKVVGMEDRGMYGRTPVMIAAWNGHVGVVKHLVRKGCNQRTLDDNKFNILHLACLGGHVDMVHYILSLKGIISMEDRDMHGRTPVMVAAWNGHVGVVKFLASKGVNLRAVDVKKYNILDMACIMGHVDIAQYILSLRGFRTEKRGKAGRTPLMVAAAYGHVGVVKFLVSKGCNLRAVDDNNDNILHVACIGGHVDMVQYIMSLKTVGIEDKGMYGRTPVLVAARMGHVGVVKLLASKGCNLKAIDDHMDNIFHLVCKGGHADVENYLRSKIEMPHMVC